ncbi:MAG: aspartate/glutamate racemase family protein [Clostridia bacterium]|nr:aspartate/glutamate racemase family protein [Clostridia bacterium]
MKMKVIVPVATSAWNDEIGTLCSTVASSLTTIDVSNIDKGPTSLECEYDEAMAAPHLMASLKTAECQGYDAALIYCFGNLGLLAGKELLRIPVLAIGEPAMAVATTIGERIGIISTLHYARRNRRRVQLFGSSKIVRVSPLSIPVMGLTDRP